MPNSMGKILRPAFRFGTFMPIKKSPKKAVAKKTTSKKTVTKKPVTPIVKLKKGDLYFGKTTKNNAVIYIIRDTVVLSTTQYIRVMKISKAHVYSDIEVSVATINTKLGVPIELKNAVLFLKLFGSTVDVEAVQKFVKEA